MRSLRVAAFLFCFLAPSSVFACEELIDFNDEEATILIEKVRTLERSDFSTSLEFNRLLCAKRKIVRDSARQVGMQSNISAIRSVALQSALFEKDVLNLTVLQKENMTKEEVDFYNKNPLINYSVMFVDVDKGCMSLHARKECNASYLLSVSGSEVDLRYNRQKAKLRLTDEGELRGVWTNGEPKQPVSMPVEIRLD